MKLIEDGMDEHPSTQLFQLYLVVYLLSTFVLQSGGRHWWNKECRSFIHVLNDVTINGGYGQNGAHHFGRYDTKATRELQPLQRLKKTLAMVFRRGPRGTFRPLNLGWGGWGRGWGCNHPPANLPGWSHGAVPPTSSPFSYFLHI